MNIFKEFFFSIFNVKKYTFFLKNKGGKVFLYIMFIILLYTIIANARIIPGTKEFVEGAKDFVQNDLPYFELKNGKFHIDEPIYLVQDTTLFSADSQYGSYIKNKEKSEWMQLIAEYDQVIMLDETSVLIKDDAQIKIFDIASGLSFSRDEVYDVIEYSYLVMGIYLILAYICNIFKFLFAAMIVALIGLMIDSFVGYGLTYGHIFKISIYAKTCMLIVKALLKLMNRSFFGFTLLSIVISCLYLGCALSHMKRQEEQEKRYNEPIIF